VCLHMSVMTATDYIHTKHATQSSQSYEDIMPVVPSFVSASLWLESSHVGLVLCLCWWLHFPLIIPAHLPRNGKIPP